MYHSPSNDKNISFENTRLITLPIGKAMERNPSHILVTYTIQKWGGTQFIGFNYNERGGNDSKLVISPCIRR